MREKIAIVIMSVSFLAAVGLGGAVVAKVGDSNTVATTVQGRTITAPSASAVGGTAATAGTQGTAGRTISSGTSAGGTPNLSTTSVGVEKGVITVGGIYDETGPVDSTVERDTVRAYFNKINDSGGVNGYKFRLIDCDSAYDPTRAHQCSQRLLSQGVLAFVGNNSVSGEQAETQYLNNQGVPIIGGLGVDSEFNLPLSYPVVASFVTDGTMTGAHSAELAKARGGVGIHPGVVLADLNFIAPARAALLKSLHEHGIQETSVNMVDISKPDYTDIVVKLRNEGADSILAGLDPFSYARFFQALTRANWHPPFGGLGLDKSNAQKEYGAAVYGAESITSVIEPQDHRDYPPVKDYIETVRKYYPNQVEALDYFSEGVWIAAKVFVEAVRRIGDKPVNRRSLVDSLNGLKNLETGLTVPLSYSPGPKHDPNRCLQYIRNENGTWTTYSGWKCI
jgi:branched-chain amino acid transport system substrate-binding protein